MQWEINAILRMDRVIIDHWSSTRPQPEGSSVTLSKREMTPALFDALFAAGDTDD